MYQAKTVKTHNNNLVVLAHVQLMPFYRLSTRDVTHVRKCTRPSPALPYCKRREAGRGLGTRLYLQDNSCKKCLSMEVLGDVKRLTKEISCEQKARMWYEDEGRKRGRGREGKERRGRKGGEGREGEIPFLL